MGKGDRKTRKGKRFISSHKKRTKINCYEIIKIIQKKTMAYKQEIENAIKDNIVQYSDVFDFSGTPEEKLYKDLYLFCRENLDIHFKRGSISYGRFLYSNNYSKNAKAKNKPNIIFINIGLMKDCIDKYLNNIALNDFSESKYPDLTAEFDRPVNDLAFQVNTQFTYYHELAHLIQFSKIETDKELQERGGDDSFNILKHKLEINADTYSSICIASHILQYINNIFGKNISQETVVTTITIIVSCLLDYIINFTNEYELYFEKHSHPHPYVRMLNIILNIINHFSTNQIFESRGIKLEAKILFNKIINYHKELVDNKIFAQGLPPLTTSNAGEIYEYFLKIKDLGDDNEFTDAMPIWNGHVDTLD